jgi:hypothetical protein
MVVLVFIITQLGMDPMAVILSLIILLQLAVEAEPALMEETERPAVLAAVVEGLVAPLAALEPLIKALVEALQRLLFHRRPRPLLATLTGPAVAVAQQQ